MSYTSVQSGVASLSAPRRRHLYEDVFRQCAPPQEFRRPTLKRIALGLGVDWMPVGRGSAGLLGFVGLSMVMIVLYSSGEVGLASKSYLLAPRSEPATSVENLVLRHSGLERVGMSKDILPFPLSAFPTAAGISLSLEAGRAQLGKAEEPEATLDEYIQEARLGSRTSLAT